MKLNIPLQKDAGLKFQILYTVLLFAAFFGMLTQLIGYHYYAKYETAFPYSSKWTVGYRDVINTNGNATTTPAAGGGNSPPPVASGAATSTVPSSDGALSTVGGQPPPFYYCNNHSYDWILNAEQIKTQGPKNMSNVGCQYLPTETITFIKTDEIQVATFFIETTVVGNQTFNRHYFTTQPDQVTFFINHGIYHRAAGVISLPKTRMFNENGDLIAEYPAGSFINVSLEVLTRGMDTTQPRGGAGTRNLLDVKRPAKGFPDEVFRMTGFYEIGRAHV